MEKNIYDHQDIAKYLSGQMAPDEQTAFENTMENDASLRLALQEALRLQTAAYHAGRQEFKAELAKELEALRESAPTKVISFRPWYLAAAAVVLIALGFWLLRPAQLSPEQLYSMHYEAPPGISYRGGDIDSLKQLAFIAYNQKNYFSAQEQFKSLLQIDTLTQRGAILFYLGISQMENELYEEAVSSFSTIRQDAYAPEARWFEALALLKMGKLVQAKAMFQGIGSSNPHFQEAQAILEKIQLK